MRFVLLYIAVKVVVITYVASSAFGASPTFSDHIEPCGPYHATCVEALVAAGINPHQYMPATDYRLQWINAFGQTMRCEAGPGYDPNVRGSVDPRDRGLWQINSTYHPEVTDAVAFDPIASTFWVARQWANGNATWWKCFQGLLDVLNPPPKTFTGNLPYGV